MDNKIVRVLVFALLGFIAGVAGGVIGNLLSNGGAVFGSNTWQLAIALAVGFGIIEAWRQRKKSE